MALNFGDLNWRYWGYGGGKRETIPHSSGIQDLSFRHPYGTEFDHAMWGVTCVMQRTLYQGSWDALGMA